MSEQQVSEIINSLIAKMSEYIGHKETNGNNRSSLIDKINDFIGVVRGSPYCLSGILYCVNQVSQEHRIEFDLPKTGHCMTFFNKCQKSIVHLTPKIGDIVIWNFVGTSLGHAGFVINVSGNKIETIEFNTKDEKAINRDGDGVYKRSRSIQGSKVMKLKGFIRIIESVK